MILSSEVGTWSAPRRDTTELAELRKKLQYLKNPNNPKLMHNESTSKALRRRPRVAAAIRFAIQ